jgi:hypothetical protein
MQVFGVMLCFQTNNVLCNYSSTFTIVQTELLFNYYVIFYSFNASSFISLYTGSHHANISNSVCVCRCLSFKGKNELNELEGRLDTRQYVELFKQNVVPFFKDNHLIHDYYPVHTRQ